MYALITPVILTFNEAPNIARTLERLSWAREVVVVDSFSSDETVEIALRFPNVRLTQRRFDTHAQQWNFAIRDTGITTPWVLALDADYLLTAGLLEELRTLDPKQEVSGYRARFVYCIEGQALRGTVYTPVTVLYRRELAEYKQDGHTQRVLLTGTIGELRNPILHDDRKPLESWLLAQQRYMRLEAEKLRHAVSDRLNWPDRLRRMRVVAPFVMLVYCLIVKLAILDGRAGWFYAFQRFVAESILSLYLLRGDVLGNKDG